MPQSNEYRALMRHHAGAPVVIATGRHGERTGMTATSFCSLSDSPPTVLVCVNRNASVHPGISRSRVFTVNLLRCGQKDVAMTFSGQTGLKGEQRFSGDWTEGASGAPCLEGALAVMECDVVGVHDHETHTVFVGKVRSLQASPDGDRPLIYFRGEFVDLLAGEPTGPSA